VAAGPEPRSDHAHSASLPSIEQLVDFVLHQTSSPVDMWAVAATLESRGMRDVDAQQLYGHRDVFALAEQIYAGCRERLTARPEPAPEPTAPAGSRMVRQLGNYARGASAGFPMLAQTFAVLLLAFALYASLGYDAEQASLVAVATLASLVVTGGFVQAVGRLTLYYLEQGSFRLAQEVTWRIVRLGVATGAAVAGLASAANVIGGWLSAEQMRSVAAYFGLLVLLWLLLAVLYALKLRLAIVGVFLLSGAVAVALTATTEVSVEVVHWVALLAGVTAAGASARHSLLRRAAGQAATNSSVRLPRPALHAYSVAPYFLYGVLYFSFLSLDRVLAWTVGEHPLPIWFDSQYELGLDLALIVLVLMLPQLEYTVHAFAASITAVQTSFGAAEARHHNRHYLRFYFRQVALLAVLALTAAALVGALLLTLPGPWGSVDTSDITWRVFVGGTAGYALLVLALLNGVFLFSLSRPWPVVLALVSGLLMNGVVGWLLSRDGEYWWSVGGLVAGAGLFAAVTTIAAVKVLARLDYYYYASY
jgi:hypothetical protein